MNQYVNVVPHNFSSMNMFIVLCCRLYLVKLMHRRFGADCVIQLSQLNNTKWIVPAGLRNEVCELTR
jgi:hypothetical protein